jgi:hypothetical protein
VSTAHSPAASADGCVRRGWETAAPSSSAAAGPSIRASSERTDSTSESASNTSEGADEGDTDRGEAMTKATATGNNNIPPHRPRKTNGGTTNTTGLPSVSAGGEAGQRHTQGDTREAALFAGPKFGPPRGHHEEVALHRPLFFGEISTATRRRDWHGVAASGSFFVRPSIGSMETRRSVYVSTCQSCHACQTLSCTVWDFPDSDKVYLCE